MRWRCRCCRPPAQLPVAEAAAARERRRSEALMQSIETTGHISQWLQTFVPVAETQQNASWVGLLRSSLSLGNPRTRKYI